MACSTSQLLRYFKVENCARRALQHAAIRQKVFAIANGHVRVLNSNISAGKKSKKIWLRRCRFWAPAAGHSSYVRGCTGASALPLGVSCVLRPCGTLYDDLVIFEDERLLRETPRVCLCVSNLDSSSGGF